MKKWRFVLLAAGLVMALGGVVVAEEPEHTVFLPLVTTSGGTGTDAVEDAAAEDPVVEADAEDAAAEAPVVMDDPAEDAVERVVAVQGPEDAAAEAAATETAQEDAAEEVAAAVASVEEQAEDEAGEQSATGTDADPADGEVDSDPAGQVQEDMASEGEDVELASEGGGSVAAQGPVYADFNNDGFDDLAVGVPFEDLTVSNAGAVHVIYGSVSGLTATGDQLWTQDAVGVLGVADANDNFGRALAAGDFNNDGFDDLAIGVPGEDLTGPTKVNVGAVNVLYGSGVGLTATGDQFWTQDSAGILAVADANDTFGRALTAGDFNNDGRADLAIGVPLEDLGATGNVGAVNVLYGSASGLTATGDQFWHQDVTGILGVANAGDQFGRALTTGDFDNDSRDDLAIGVPLEDLTGQTNVGAVNVIYGAAGGLTATGDDFWHQDVAGVLGVADASDNFGDALAAGDFNNNGYDDLAIGVPLEDLSGKLNVGAVNVLYGGVGGLTAAGDQFWNQDIAGILGVADANDNFGRALTTGRFNGDGRADLAIGVPNEDLGGTLNVGAVNVIYGSATGLTAAGDQFWNQDVAGVLGIANAGDQFGSSLAAGDFDNDGPAELAIGVPLEDLTGATNAGAVNVLYGAAGGLTAVGDQFLNQNSAGILGVAEANDQFGAAVR